MTSSAALGGVQGLVGVKVSGAGINSEWLIGPMGDGLDTKRSDV
jgi:hypothetical protein